MWYCTLTKETVRRDPPGVQINKYTNVLWIRNWRTLLHMRQADAACAPIICQHFLHDTPSWTPSWTYDVISKIDAKNRSTKFHPDPIWNDGALAFWRVCPNKKKNNNKMRSNLRSVLDPKGDVISRLFYFTCRCAAKQANIDTVRKFEAFRASLELFRSSGSNSCSSRIDGRRRERERRSMRMRNGDEDDINDRIKTDWSQGANVYIVRTQWSHSWPVTYHPETESLTGAS